jgi:hypothetical protein
MSNNASLPSLDEETIRLAYQLFNFYNIGHQYAKKEVSQDCLNIIKFAVAHYPNPSYPLRDSSPTEESSTRRGRSTGRDLIPDFPPDWSLEGGRSEVRKAQTSFLALSSTLRSDPSFTEWLKSLSKTPFSPESFSTSNMDDNNDNRPPVLTEEEKERQMIARMTAAMVAALQAANLLGNSPAQQASPPTDLTGSNKQFKAEEIGFFDPELGIEDDSTGIGDKLWIQNVFIFIQRIKDIVAIRGEEIV